MAIKVLLFSFGAMSYAVLWDNYITNPYQWFGIWDQWDFGYYQEIAQFGYSGTDGSIAFYPLFPWLVRLVACVSRSYLAAGFIVSGIASVVAAVLLRRLVHLDYPASVAMRSVGFLPHGGSPFVPFAGVIPASNYQRRPSSRAIQELIHSV